MQDYFRAFGRSLHLMFHTNMMQFTFNKAALKYNEIEIHAFI